MSNAFRRLLEACAPRQAPHDGQLPQSGFLLVAQPPASEASETASVPSAVVVVSKVCTGPGCGGFVELKRKNVSYTAGQAYELTFWGKASVASATATVESLQAKAPWTSMFPSFPVQFAITFPTQPGCTTESWRCQHPR